MSECMDVCVFARSAPQIDSDELLEVTHQVLQARMTMHFSDHKLLKSIISSSFSPVIAMQCHLSFTCPKNPVPELVGLCKIFFAFSC